MGETKLAVNNDNYRFQYVNIGDVGAFVCQQDHKVYHG